MKIRLRTLTGETLYLCDALMMLHVAAYGGDGKVRAPRCGQILQIECISNAPATVVKTADDRDRVNGVGLSMSELFVVPEPRDD